MKIIQIIKNWLGLTEKNVLPDEFKVLITADKFTNTSYYDLKGCALASTLKEMKIPFKGVAGTYVGFTNGVDYSIDKPKDIVDMYEAEVPENLEITLTKISKKHYA